MVSRTFDPATDCLRIVTNAMMYRVRPFREDGSAVWDIAVCSEVKPRANAMKLGVEEDHVIEQPIVTARLPGEALELRSRLGSAVLDWSLFAGAGTEPASTTCADVVRQALLLVQVCEAMVKALECNPVEVLETSRHSADAAS